MEKPGVCPPPEPAAHATVQQPYGQPNFSQPDSDPPTYEQPPYGQLPFSGAVPPHSTPATVDVRVEASSIPTDTPQSPLQRVPPAEGWFARNQRNKPQTNSAGSGALLLVSGGMNIAWSCEFDEFQGLPNDTHIQICWYIATIVGALVSAFITNHTTKKPIFLFSAFLVVIGGIFLVALPHHNGAIVVARYLNGFAVGLVFVQSMVLIGEEVHSSQRGRAASLLEMGSFTLGIFLQILFASAYNSSASNYKFGVTQLHGIVVIVYGLITCAISYFFIIESPVYHLLRGNENQAIDCLRRLQRPNVITQETYRQLEELKRYIEYNSHSTDLMLPTLFKLCLYRSLIALSFSPITTMGLMLSTAAYVGDAIWPFIFFGLFLWLGSFFSAFLMDVMGRKKLMLIGAFVCASLAIGIGYIFNDLFNILNESKMGEIVYLLIVLQLFAGIFNSSSSAYLTEAFPLHRKTYYIAISFIMQLFVSLIIAVCNYNERSLGSYFITFGIFYVAAFFLGIIFLPETKKFNLRDAQDKFRTNIYNWSE